MSTVIYYTAVVVLLTGAITLLQRRFQHDDEKYAAFKRDLATADSTALADSLALDSIANVIADSVVAKLNPTLTAVSAPGGHLAPPTLYAERDRIRLRYLRSDNRRQETQAQLTNWLATGERDTLGLRRR